MKWKSLSSVQLFVTPCTIQSIEFSRPEYWSGYSFPSPGDLINSGIEPRPTCNAGGFFTSWATKEAQEYWSGQPIPSPGDLPDSGIEVSCIAGEFFCQLSYQGSPTDVENCISQGQTQDVPSHTLLILQPWCFLQQVVYSSSFS